jgi:hypothetical protein
VKAVSQYIERLRFRYLPRFAEWLIDLSTYEAQRCLSDTGRIRILVDNTVLAHATTHETAWISTGVTQWGNQTRENGYAARIAVHPADSNAREYKHIKYLPGLISLSRHGLVQFYSSAELKYEQFIKPSGMFRGYGYYDYNLFGGVQLDSLDGYIFENCGYNTESLPNAAEQQRLRLQSKAGADPDYRSLVNVLGSKNSQDAWHIRTAELHDIFCFLTMDFRLIQTLESQKGANRIKALKTKVMTPESLGNLLGLIPIPPTILSYTNASYPVRSNLYWPEERLVGRRRPKTPDSNM